MSAYAPMIVALLASGCMSTRYEIEGPALRAFQAVPEDERDDVAVAAVRSGTEQAAYLRGGAILIERPSAWSLRNRGVMEEIDPAQPPLALGDDRFEVKAGTHGLTRLGRVFLVMGAALATAGLVLMASGSGCGDLKTLLCGRTIEYAFGEGLAVAGAFEATVSALMWITGETLFSVEVPGDRSGYRHLGRLRGVAPAPTAPAPLPAAEPRKGGRLP